MGCTNSAQVSIACTNEDPFILTILGLSGVGKSSIIESITGDYNPIDPPIRTNGFVIREAIIRQTKYRFYDVSGYASHKDEWIDCLEKSDAAVLVTDPSGISAGLFFTKDIIATIEPIINQKKIPIFILLNKDVDGTDASPVEGILDLNFSNVPHNWGRCKNLEDGPQIIFSWLESVLPPK